VLTNTQLRSAKTSELERLHARIEAELENKRQQVPNRTQDAGKVQLFYSGHTGHYQ